MSLEFEKSTECLPKLLTWKCFCQLFSLEQLFSTGCNHQHPVRCKTPQTDLTKASVRPYCPPALKYSGKKKMVREHFRNFLTYMCQGRSLKTSGCGSKEVILKCMCTLFFFKFPFYIWLSQLILWSNGDLSCHDNVVWRRVAWTIRYSACQPEVVDSTATTIFRYGELIPRDYAYPPWNGPSWPIDMWGCWAPHTTLVSQLCGNTYSRLLKSCMCFPIEFSVNLQKHHSKQAEILMQKHEWTWCHIYRLPTPS